MVELENKAWYRFLKVIYIVAVVITILLVGFFSFISKPSKVVDYEKSYFKCNNKPDIIYFLDKNIIYLNQDNIMYTGDDRKARSTCRDDKTIDSIPNEENYTLTLVYKNSDSYTSWFGYTALAFFIAWVVFKLISIAFFYIAVGKKPDFS